MRTVVEICLECRVRVRVRLWPPDAKNWLIWKDPDAGKDWRQEEKGMTEDETVGWHRWLDGHEFEWTPGVGDGSGGLACCSPRGRKELETTERLNWTENVIRWMSLPLTERQIKDVVTSNIDQETVLPGESVKWMEGESPPNSEKKNHQELGNKTKGGRHIFSGRCLTNPSEDYLIS